MAEIGSHDAIQREWAGASGSHQNSYPRVIQVVELFPRLPGSISIVFSTSEWHFKGSSIPFSHGRHLSGAPSSNINVLGVQLYVKLVCYRFPVAVLPFLAPSC